MRVQTLVLLLFVTSCADHVNKSVMSGMAGEVADIERNEVIANLEAFAESAACQFRHNSY